jgi:hypothetical protein
VVEGMEEGAEEARAGEVEEVEEVKDPLVRLSSIHCLLFSEHVLLKKDGK